MTIITNQEEFIQAIENKQSIIEIDGQFDYDLSMITYPCKIMGQPGSRIDCYSAEENATFDIKFNDYTEIVPEEYR